tara:strand:- start:3021 stop:3236 length:216 start_codon:yes stop_codon:yes gene_type:complete
MRMSRLELHTEMTVVLKQMTAVTDFWMFYLTNTNEEAINKNISEYYIETIDALREQEAFIQSKLERGNNDD